MLLEIVAPNEQAARIIAGRLAPKSRIVEVLDADHADREVLSRWWASVRLANPPGKQPFSPFSPFGRPKPEPRKKLHGQ